MARVELGLEELAKYPFLPEAGDYVRKRWSLEVDDLAQPDFINVVKRAKERVMEAIKKRQLSEEITEVESEILSFPITLMMVKATGLEHLAIRVSLAEAIRVENFLKKERKPVLSHIFRSVIKIELQEEEETIGSQTFDFKIPVVEYLKRSSKFHEPEWKLVNRVVDKGWVYLKSQDLVRLIREEIRSIIYTRLKEMKMPRLPPSLEEAVKEIAQLSPQPKAPQEAVALTPEKYPPCVAHALDLIRKGQNVPHFGRFLMTTYLLAVGKSVDDVVSLFPRLPDFDERLTRYQVEHIAGLRGGRVKYNVPSCRTLQTHSFCFKVDECDEIRNPLRFGRASIKEKRRSK